MTVARVPSLRSSTGRSSAPADRHWRTDSPVGSPQEASRMANFFLRKLARNIGLLDRVRSIKRRFTGGTNVAEFKPADPRLLVSTLRCLHWLLEHHLAEGSDYLEFGIFRGFNLWYTQAVARALAVN